MLTEYYSGIECVERAAKLLGRPVDMIDLLSAPQAHLQDGTPQTLAQLGIAHGLNATVLKHLAKDQIAHFPYPMLIHVMGSQYSIKPDYYTLYTGMRGDVVNLFSPSLGEFSVPLDHLASDRLGEAIVLSRDPLPRDATCLHRAPPVTQCTLMVIVLVGLAACTILRHRQRGLPRMFSQSRQLRRSSLVQLFRLIAFALVLTFVCRLVSGGPLLPAVPASPDHPIDFLLPPTSAFTASATKPPEISLEAALRLSHTDALFVDARDPREYADGHIRGAILCPADDLGHWQLHMAGIDPHSRLVVYCAQASCGKGEYVATFLLKNGFTQVSLYRDGWVRWTGPREIK